MENRQEAAIERFPQSEREYHNVLSAATELFISLHIFDLEEGTFTTIKTNEHIARLTRGSLSIQEMLTTAMENLSAPESVHAISEFTTLSTLPERMKGKKVISEVFRGIINGWCKAIFIRVGEDEPLRHVLYIVESVDEQAKQLEEQKKLLEENRQLESFIGAEYTSVCQVDLSAGAIRPFRIAGRLRHAFETLERAPGIAELAEAYVEHFVYEDDRAELRNVLTREYVAQQLAVGESLVRVYRNELGEFGEMKLVRTDKDSCIMGFAEKNQEIMEINEKIYTDSLTRIKNRKYYDEHLASQPCEAVIMADIDGFKNINDTYGHPCGDDALFAVASALRSCVRDEDNVVRYGGDEFLITFREITREALENRAELMRAAAEKIQLTNYPQLRLTMSFGATFGEGSTADMLPFADKLLYESKEKKNTVTVRPFSAEA